jgi:hypothetical protein
VAIQKFASISNAQVNFWTGALAVMLGRSLSRPLAARMLDARADGNGEQTLGKSAGWRAGALIAGALIATSVAAPVLADCYDVLGCSDKTLYSKNYSYLASPDGPTCDFLYMMRNRIYAQHGYCFKTARGMSEIGNTGCFINNQAAVPLSTIERNNIATIHKAEVAKSCPD